MSNEDLAELLGTSMKDVHAGLNNINQELADVKQAQSTSNKDIMGKMDDLQKNLEATMDAKVSKVKEEVSSLAAKLAHLELQFHDMAKTDATMVTPDDVSSEGFVEPVEKKTKVDPWKKSDPWTKGRSNTPVGAAPPATTQHHNIHTPRPSKYNNGKDIYACDKSKVFVTGYGTDVLKVVQEKSYNEICSLLNPTTLIGHRVIFRGGSNHFLIVFASPSLASDAVENFKAKTATSPVSWVNTESKETKKILLRVERPPLTKIIQRVAGSLWKLVEGNEEYKKVVPAAAKLNGNGAGGKVWVEMGEVMANLFSVQYRDDDFVVKPNYENLVKFGISNQTAEDMVAKAKESLVAR